MCLVIKDKLDEVFLIFLYMLLPHAAIKPESSPELSVGGTLLVGHLHRKLGGQEGLILFSRWKKTKGTAEF